MWQQTERRNKRCPMSQISRIDILPPLEKKPSLMDSKQPGGRRTTFSLCCALACDSISTSVTSHTFHLCLHYSGSDTFPQKMHLPVCYVLASSVQNSSRCFFFHQVFRRKTTVSFNRVRRAFNHIILLNYPQVSAHLTPVESNLSTGSSFRSGPGKVWGCVGG